MLAFLLYILVVLVELGVGVESSMLHISSVVLFGICPHIYVVGVCCIVVGVICSGAVSISMVLVWSVCSFWCSVVSVLSVFRVFSSHWGTASMVLGVIFSGLGLGFCGGGGLCMGLCFCHCVFLALRFLFCYSFCYGRFGGFLGWFLSGCICSSRQMSTFPSVVSAVDGMVISV